MEKKNERDGSEKKQERVWDSPDHNLRHTAHLPQRMQHELVKGDLRRRPQVIDPTAGTDHFDFLKITGQLLLKATDEIRVQKQSAFAVAFHIVQRDIAPGLGIDLLIVQDVNYQELIFFYRELLKSSAPASRVEQIADNDDEAGMRKKIGKGVSSRSQVSLAMAGQLAEKAKQTKHLLPSPPQGKRSLEGRGKRRATDPV